MVYENLVFTCEHKDLNRRHVYFYDDVVFCVYCLWTISKDLPQEPIHLDTLVPNENIQWEGCTIENIFQNHDHNPIAKKHFEKIKEANLLFAILTFIDPDNGFREICDGLHRTVAARLQNKKFIDAKTIPWDQMQKAKVSMMPNVSK